MTVGYQTDIGSEKYFSDDLPVLGEVSLLEHIPQIYYDKLKKDIRAVFDPKAEKEPVNRTVVGFVLSTDCFGSRIEPNEYTTLSIMRYIKDSYFKIYYGSSPKGSALSILNEKIAWQVFFTATSKIEGYELRKDGSIAVKVKEGLYLLK